MSWKTIKSAGHTQAGGAVTLDLAGWEETTSYQLQVEVSAVPTAGTLTVAVKTPGATEFSDIGTVDLTGSELIKRFEANASQVKVTPASFDADKTFGLYLFGSDK